MATYSTSSASGIYLNTFASQNPVTITNTGTVAPNGTDAVGVFGYGPSSAWTIINYGVVNAAGSNSVGIYLQGGGAITNHSGGTISNQSGGLISGEDGVFVRYAAVTVTNAGSIIGNPTSGPGVAMLAGGSVTNLSGGTITGIDGVFAATVASTVINSGSIRGYFYGVVLQQGGVVANTAGLICGGGDSIITNGTNAATITNQATISGRYRDGAIVLGGGTINNASTGTIASCYFGVSTYSDPVTVTNQGEIIAHSPIADVQRSTVSAGTVVTSTIIGDVAMGLFAGGVVNNEPSAMVAGYHCGTVLTAGHGQQRGRRYDPQCQLGHRRDSSAGDRCQSRCCRRNLWKRRVSAGRRICQQQRQRRDHRRLFRRADLRRRCNRHLAWETS